VCVSPAVIQELKRIVQDSEIMKYENPINILLNRNLLVCREDDAKWPKKNKDGRQELEIRLGDEHISFEVYLPPFFLRSFATVILWTCN